MTADRYAIWLGVKEDEIAAGCTCVPPIITFATQHTEDCDLDGDCTCGAAAEIIVTHNLECPRA